MDNQEREQLISELEQSVKKTHELCQKLGGCAISITAWPTGVETETTKEFSNFGAIHGNAGDLVQSLMKYMKRSKDLENVIKEAAFQATSEELFRKFNEITEEATE